MMTGSPLRGGNRSYGVCAGLAAIALCSARTSTGSYFGFRPAFDVTSRNHLTGCCQCVSEKDATSSAIAEIQNKSPDESGDCLFEQVCDFNNLLSAAYSCRKGKTTSRSTMLFFSCLEDNLMSLQKELLSHSYCLSRYHHFYVFEPKRRLISAPDFRDRVIHRAIYNIIEPIIDNTFIKDSYACRRGKGTHAGADRAQSMIRNVTKKGQPYALKADIYHYFSSINHEKLKQIIDIKVKCPRIRELLYYIVDASPSDDDGVGIPLGNLTSQIFANIYLNELDRFIKIELKEKNYVRYMDDFIIISNDKEYLHQCRRRIEVFLDQQLSLSTNSKTQVFPISRQNGRGLDFLGYRIYHSHRLLRKSSIKRIKSKMKMFRRQYQNNKIGKDEIIRSLTSWIAHANHADSNGLKNHVLKLRNNYVHIQRH